MIPLPAWLTVKPLLAVVGALAVAVGVQTVRLSLAHGAEATAKAEKTAAQAATVAAITERDAYKLALTNAQDAAFGWEAVAEERHDLLNECYVERDRNAVENQQGIIAAQQEATRARNALHDWVNKYADAIRSPDCAAARQQMDTVCAAISDY